MKRNEFIKASAGIILSSSIMTGSYAQDLTQTIGTEKIKPFRLQPGDLIAITAPSGSIWNKKHIEKIESILKNEGFKTKLGQTLFEQDGYLAGADELRANELMTFFEDKSVKAILTMRGGWGCARILDMLDYEVIRQNPKIIMGFSDITSLVNAIYTRANVVTYHGPCGYSSWGSFTMESVKKALISTETFVLKNSSSSDQIQKTWAKGKAIGELVGGNLTVIASMVGTRFEPIWQDKILFLEEIGEEPYRVDRMLWQLKQANVFSQVNGVIIGSFRKCEPEESHKSFSLEQVFDQHFSNVPFPVYSGASFGHIGPKFTLPIGVMVEMDADNFIIRTLENSVK
jgi:muramoyltetrapeptide carboxypeptidase